MPQSPLLASRTKVESGSGLPSAATLLRLLAALVVVWVIAGPVATATLDWALTLTAPPQLAPVDLGRPPPTAGRDPSVPDAGTALSGAPDEAEEPVPTF